MGEFLSLLHWHRRGDTVRLIDLAGKTFGRLTVLQRHPISRHGAIWLCRCECGTVKNFDGGALRSGDTRSCGCLRADRLRAKTPSWTLAFGEASFNALFRNYGARAKDHGRDFTLSKDEFRYLVRLDCHYCGAPPSQVFIGNKKHNHGDFTYNGLDRVDNARGYVTDNVVACCGDCNIAKATRSRAEFLAWVERVHKRSCLNA